SHLHKPVLVYVAFRYPPTLKEWNHWLRVPLNCPYFSLPVELTENIGLPVNLLEKHDLWPAYVTYTSPLVKRLIEKSKARDVERLQTAEESRPTYRQSKPPSVTQLERRKSFTSSGNMTFEDVRSETTLSAWGPFSMSDTGPPVVPERTHFHADARASPTADYNKIIFSRKLRTRVLPYLDTVRVNENCWGKQKGTGSRQR
uniref:Uncharacterized protein n=1 Tax=Phocoena sinus TaxID=42100 RepID=A0A8C9CTM9_PHOSS